MKVIKWKQSDTGYGAVQNGYVGKWKCFSTCWDGTRSRDDPKKIKLSCMLPGIKTHLGNYSNTEDAQVYAQNILIHWLKGLEE